MVQITLKLTYLVILPNLALMEFEVISPNFNAIFLMTTSSNSIINKIYA